MMHAPSLRVRLTLWYTALLLVVLAAFAGAVRWEQERIGLRRVDRELEALGATAANVARAEIAEHLEPPAVAAEVCDTVGVHGRAVAVYDGAGLLLAARWNGLDVGGWDRRQSADWTIEASAGPWRVRARRETFGSTALVLLVGTPLVEVRRERRVLDEAMLVGIPLALLLAAAGGLWLATLGLAPINQMVARLGDALRTQRQFMADASHELRTPVSVVRTAADVVLNREHRDESEYRDALAIVGGQARRLSRLVDDMLVLARADAGGYPLRPVDLYVDELIAECRHGVDVLAAARGVTLRAGPLPEIAFRGDEELLRQLITNVLQNAVQHTPAGGLVAVEAAASNGHVRIRVIDSGPGIADADRARIFDRFVQLDSARRTQGTGLGLPIARWIAEAHGGTLELEDSGARGSTFCVTLPRPPDA